MSDYYDEDWDDYDRYDDDDLDDEHEFVSDCGDPRCLMNFAHHMRSECHTQEMIDAYERESNPRWWRSAWCWLLSIPHRLRSLRERRSPRKESAYDEDLPF